MGKILHRRGTKMWFLVLALSSSMDFQTIAFTLTKVS